MLAKMKLSRKLILKLDVKFLEVGTYYTATSEMECTLCVPPLSR
jgi:hypothetical protein